MYFSLCHLDYLWTYCLFYWTRIQRDKPTRYSALVEASTAYSHLLSQELKNFLKLNVKEKNIRLQTR